VPLPKFHRWLPAMSAASCNADWSEEGEQSCNKTCDKADDDNPGDVHDDCVCIHRARRQVARPDVNSSFTLHEDGPVGLATPSPIGVSTDALPISVLDQRSNQAQEFLLLWSVASGDEKGSDLDVGDLST
jgi:hypothetical protein